jgi:predicted NodU family carbamoyl transferase
MKLLAVSLPRHDGNMSYFDGERVHYIKLERTKQDKRFHIDNKWSWIYEAKQLWGIDLKDIDHIIFDFHAETFYDIDNLPSEIADVLSGKTNVVKLEPHINVFNGYVPNANVWYIGHHYAHSLSTWMLHERKPDVCFVIDGIGDHRTWSVFKNDVLIDKGIKENGSIGGYMMQCAGLLDIKAAHGNDLPGKLMGLQSYGTVDDTYLRYLKQFDITKINDIFSLMRWYN